MYMYIETKENQASGGHTERPTDRIAFLDFPGVDHVVSFLIYGNNEFS